MKKLSLIVFLILGLSVVAVASDALDKSKRKINLKEQLHIMK